MSVFEELIDEKLLKILTLFMHNKEQQFHLQKISQETNIPISTVFRIIRKLTNLDLIDFTTIGKLKIYRIAQNDKTRELDVYLKDA